MTESLSERGCLILAIRMKLIKEELKTLEYQFKLISMMNGQATHLFHCRADRKRHFDCPLAGPPNGRQMMSIQHHSLPWYIFSSAFPIIAVIACWICFYSLGHSTPGRILTISETMVPFPENRIFAVSMNIESVFLFVLYLIRNKIVTTLANRRNVFSTSLSVKRIVMYICTAAVPLGLAVVSDVTLENQLGTHIFGAVLFFYGSIIYFVVSDFALKDVDRQPALYSRIVSWVSIGCCILYQVLFPIGGSENTGVANAAALFQYATALAIFFKVFIFYFDIPKHYLQVVKRDD
jgi:hypothetical protein